MLVSIDGYDISAYVDELSETFTLLEGVQSQRKQDRSVFYDIIGTESVYTITLRRNVFDPWQDPNSDYAKVSISWDELWELIRRPVDYHTVVVADRDGTTYPFRAHIVSGTRALEYVSRNWSEWGENKRFWGDYTITLIPESPQW